MQIPAGGAADAGRPARPRGNRVCNVDFEVSPTAVPAVVTKGVQPGPRELGAHFSTFEYTPAANSRADRVRRLAAVPPADGRRQLHARLARGARRGGGDEPRWSPFAPTTAHGRRTIRESLAGLPVEPRLRFLPFAHFWRQGWSRARLAAGRAFPRPGRRPALLRLDVPAAARRPPLDDGPRPRAAAVPGVGAGPDAADARREVPQRRPYLRRDLRQRGVHEGRGGRAAGRRPRRRWWSPTRAWTSASGPTGERADLGRPYVLTVATLEPRKNLETLLAARLPEGHALAVVGAEGWGPQPALDRPDVIRLGYVDDERARRALPRRGGVRVPLAVRGLRHPDRRGDGERRAGRRLRAPVAGRGFGRRRRSAPTRTTRRRSSAALAEALARRDELVWRGLDHARPFTWTATGRAMYDALSERL